MDLQLFYPIYEEYANYKVLINTLDSIMNVRQTDNHMLSIDSEINNALQSFIVCEISHHFVR